jgi:hypothetical protein
MPQQTQIKSVDGCSEYAQVPTFCKSASDFVSKSIVTVTMLIETRQSYIERGV